VLNHDLSDFLIVRIRGEYLKTIFHGTGGDPISLVGMGVPAFQREFRITPYLSAVSSVTSTALTRGS
jgi:hypothetical protein